MTERDLAQKFVEYLKDSYDLFFEFMDIDIYGKAKNHTVGIEVKTSLNFKVIQQAYQNIDCCNYSYVAVPKPKEIHFGFEFCKMLGIGVLVYSEEYNSVYEKVKPKLNRHARKLNPSEVYKKAIPGTKSGEHGIKSPFQISVENIEIYVKRHEGCTIKEAIENTTWHWSNMSSAKSCVANYIKSGVINSIELKNGKLFSGKSNNDAAKYI